MLASPLCASSVVAASVGSPKKREALATRKRLPGQRNHGSLDGWKNPTPQNQPRALPAKNASAPAHSLGAARLLNRSTSQPLPPLRLDARRRNLNRPKASGSVPQPKTAASRATQRWPS